MSSTAPSQKMLILPRFFWSFKPLTISVVKVLQYMYSLTVTPIEYWILWLTRIINYILPDTFEKKLVHKQTFIEYITFWLYLHAYSKSYPKRHVLTLDVWDRVIFVFLVINDLKHFQKICMINYLCIKWGSLAKHYLI